MLILAVAECKINNSYWWTFINEFSLKSYDGKSFQTMAEAVEFANEAITYKGQSFDLVTINQPRYQVVNSLTL